MGWPRHRSGKEIINANRKDEEKTPCGKPKDKWKDSGEIGCEGVEWIHLALTK
jgi:hypothetical protein